MSTAQDTRPNIAGYPLPWKITEPHHLAGLELVDDDGDMITSFDNDDGDDLYPELARHVNETQARIAALENSLKILVSNFAVATMEIERTGARAALDAVNWQAKVILANLGLADRLPCNPTEAEEAVSS